jgi:small-conductance mechanosensitive channel
MVSIASLWEIIKPAITKFIVGVVILLIGVVIAKLAERVLHKLLHELELDAWLRRFKIKFALEETLAVIVKYALYVGAVIMTLNTVGWTSYVANFLAIIVIFLVIAGMLLSLKDSIPNFFAGISIHRRGFVKEGDIIRVRDIEGEVRTVKLLETRIKTQTGDLVFIPNTFLTQNEVTRFKRKKTLLK